MRTLCAAILLRRPTTPWNLTEPCALPEYSVDKRDEVARLGDERVSTTADL
jgi:hypothetical protein